MNAAPILVGLLLAQCLLAGALWFLFRRKIGAIALLPVNSPLDRTVFRHFPMVMLGHAVFVALLIIVTFLFLW